MSKPTNMPWSVDQWGAVVESDGRTTVAAQGFALSGRPEAVANAAFIVKAVNSHEQLVRALRAAENLILTDMADGHYTEEAALIKAALAAVEAA